MRKLLFSSRKEVLLIVRDIPGMMILFLMPVILMTVVILAQEYTLRSQTGKSRLLIIDESRSAFAKAVVKDLSASGFFVTDSVVFQGGSARTRAVGMIGEGKYPLGLYIGPGDSAIEIICDPAVSGAYRANLVTPLKYLVKATQTRQIMERMLASSAGEMKPLIDKAVDEAMAAIPPLQESFAGSGIQEIRPTAIQNIVPGFILFAMFFVVIPLAASIIGEKNEGAFRRLMTLPVGFATILGSKVLVYFIVCLVQFLLMMMVGLWLFPALLGLPGLEVGHNLTAILFATMASSLAAIGFGILVGSVSGTMAQASLFGSVMVVLLGVISGTFLPVYVLPGVIKAMSILSPMRWGIDNYLDVFIRGAGLVSIMPRSLLLIAFFGLAMTGSIYIFAGRKV